MKRSLDDPAPPHTKHTKIAVPQITKSSQVEGRAVVGRRVRDLVFLHGFDDLRLFERARVVFVDHNKALPGGLRRLRVDVREGFGRREPCVQELARELGDLLRGGLGLGLARLGALRELVPQRRLDRLLPARNVDR